MSRVLAAILVLLVSEAVALAIYRIRNNEWRYYSQDAANLLAGGFFVLLLMVTAPENANAFAYALLGGAGMAHAGEVMLRLRNQRHP